MTDILTSDMTSDMTNEEQEQDVKKVLERARLERLRTWLWRCAPIWAGGDVIKFTVQPTGNRVLTLRDFTEPIDCVVDWGDGTKDAITSSNNPVSHTYADATPRTVTISGTLGGLWNAPARAAGSDFVVSVDRISSKSLVSLENTFKSIATLKKLPARIDAPNLVNCDKAFYCCGSIESPLPPLWKTNPQASHVNTFTESFAPSLSLWAKHGKACPHLFLKENSGFAYREECERRGLANVCAYEEDIPYKKGEDFRTHKCIVISGKTCSSAICKQNVRMAFVGGLSGSCGACLLPYLDSDSPRICYDGGSVNRDNGKRCPLPNEEVAHPSWAEARAAGWL